MPNFNQEENLRKSQVKNDSCQLLELVNSFTRNFFSTVNANISATGQEVTLVGNQNGVVSEFIRFNSRGQIDRDVFTPQEPAFPNATGGATDTGFSKTSLLTRAATGSGIKVSVARTGFTNTGVPKQFVDGVGSTLKGGRFSPDGRFIVISYVLASSPAIAPISIIRILDSTTLEEFASTTVEGVVPASVFFILKGNQLEKEKHADSGRCKDKLYLLTSTTRTATPPFFGQGNLLIFRIKRGQLILKTSQILPQAALSYDATPLISYKGFVDIAVGTVKSTDNQNFVSTNGCHFPNTDELRLYKFDGKHLKLVNSQKTNTNVKEVAWHPSSKLLLTGQQATLTSSNILVFYSAPELCVVKFIALSTSGTVSAEFSASGKFLIVVSGFNDGDSTTIPNVFLYFVKFQEEKEQVRQEEFKQICHNEKQGNKQIFDVKRHVKQVESEEELEKPSKAHHPNTKKEQPKHPKNKDIKFRCKRKQNHDSSSSTESESDSSSSVESFEGLIDKNKKEKVEEKKDNILPVKWKNEKLSTKNKKERNAFEQFFKALPDFPKI